MDVQVLEDHKLSPSMEDYHANVDTSRPFRSVKEAVAIFGERYLAREIYPPKKFTFPNQETPHCSPSPLLTHDTQPMYSTSPEESSIDTNDHHCLISDASRKLEETNVEVKMLKERKSETEVTLVGAYKRKEKKVMKKKKIITLVGGLFTRKKRPSTTMHNPLFSNAINQDEQ